MQADPATVAGVANNWNHAVDVVEAMGGMMG